MTADEIIVGIDDSPSGRGLPLGSCVRPIDRNSASRHSWVGRDWSAGVGQ
jgi:hypothetical protein